MKALCTLFAFLILGFFKCGYGVEMYPILAIDALVEISHLWWRCLK